MARKSMTAGLLIAVIMAGAAGGQARAADETPATTVLLPQKSIDDLAVQLTAVERGQSELRDVAAKLDRVLQQQQKILEELDIIKIRVSRR